MFVRFTNISMYLFEKKSLELVAIVVCYVKTCITVSYLCDLACVLWFPCCYKQLNWGLLRISAISLNQNFVTKPIIVSCEVN